MMKKRILSPQYNKKYNINLFLNKKIRIWKNKNLQQKKQKIMNRLIQNKTKRFRQKKKNSKQKYYFRENYI